jgi:hypothetical protein
MRLKGARSTPASDVRMVKIATRHWRPPAVTIGSHVVKRPAGQPPIALKLQPSVWLQLVVGRAGHYVPSPSCTQSLANYGPRSSSGGPPTTNKVLEGATFGARLSRYRVCSLCASRTRAVRRLTAIFEWRPLVNDRRPGRPRRRPLEYGTKPAAIQLAKVERYERAGLARDACATPLLSLLCVPHSGRTNSSFSCVCVALFSGQLSSA